MNETDTQLEHLISRYLDDEATSSERREMRRQLDGDPAAQALFDETSSLDRELGHALRGAMGRSTTTRSAPRWQRMGQMIGLAAAACLLTMLWVAPPKPASDRQEATAMPRPVGLSWRDPVADPAPAVDGALYERPYTGNRHISRDWIVIPGSHPDECYVIEVNRVRTRVLAIQRDY